MGRLGIPEDEAIQNSLITRSLENAQEKIEGLNFDSRKHVLEYDDVLNFQRKTFYSRRRSFLMKDSEFVDNYLSDVLDMASSDVKDVILQKKINDESTFIEAFSTLALQTFDMFWVDHLEMMDYLRSSVNLRAYGQRDPLVEYKKEGLRLFKEMEQNIKSSILNMMTKVDVSVANQNSEIEKQAIKITGSDTNEYKQKDSEVGRNDMCPCGSGKKFKKCHGK
jgi:preprotein translocase subunit SecA